MYMNLCIKTLWLVVHFYKAIRVFMGKAMFWIFPVFAKRKILETGIEYFLMDQVDNLQGISSCVLINL